MRAGTAADIGHCLQLWRAAVLQRDGSAVDGAALEAQILRSKTKFDGEVNAFLIAEDASGITGFVLALPHEPRGPGSHLALLGIDPRAQRQGVGRSLLLGLAEFRREQGDEYLDLRVLPGNTGARRLYESLGWRVSGEPVPHEVTGVPFQRYVLPL